jgi:N-acetylmuramoyl-L-alanine amidase
MRKERVEKHMNKRLVAITFCVIFVLFAAYQLKNHDASKETFSKNIVRYGATGSDVYELQGRLKLIGFYHGAIDGDFGYKTLRAVKRFQGEFGLRVDGIVGPKTKLRIWEATKIWRPTAATGGGRGAARHTSTSASANLVRSSNRGLSAQDLKLMANAVHGESRGEPYIGQVAVAAVILNRVGHARFPNSVPGVIFQPGAFTAVADGQIWLQPDPSSQRAVRDAINGWDPTGEAIYYFNPATATSKWIWGRPQIKTIGRHIFCK